MAELAATPMLTPIGNTTHLASCSDEHGVAMPNQPKTPNRVIRVEDELWRAAKRRAAENGETVSDVIRRALKDYIK